MLSMSIRRFATYVGFTACVLLILFTLRDGIISKSVGYQTPILGSRPGSQDGKPANEASEAQPIKQPSVSDRRFRWDSVPKHYPIKSHSKLPQGEPKKLPRVQYQFAPESAAHAAKRRERQAAVKHTFTRCWKSYSEKAWGHDELAPLSGGVRDGFGGWAASLVDNLDNLWLMDMKPEFEAAVKAAVEIDLGTATTETINVFETTIRHLGGFLAAYDLSGDRRLLAKAKEFGEMLLVPFDTPNHMPITRWKPGMAMKEKQVADPVVLVAEIGSLEMEFTRLTQLTGDMRWYDAVDRIIRIFEKQQYDTHLPGMWPVTVNAKEADFTQDTFFTLSAMSDSLYEYFPKMHAMLGGVDPVYEKLYNGSMPVAIKHNLFRPMTPDNADILVSGNVRASRGQGPVLEPQGQHLVCFAGGMFALGGKLFDIPEHVEIGKKLTDGCIWTYKAFPLGIMPEVFEMLPCESRQDCKWDEQKWRDRIREKQGEKSNLDEIIRTERLQKGFTSIRDHRYILRPEAIESVFILYRITGEQYLQDAAWDMFTAIVNATESQLANAALSDVTFSREQLAQGNTGGTTQMDSMESFWMAETLKYFYLIFSEPDVVDLDEWVFNTEAHAFKRQLPGQTSTDRQYV